MKDLLRQIERKLVGQQLVDDYEILIDTGWKDIERIGK